MSADVGAIANGAPCVQERVMRGDGLDAWRVTLACVCIARTEGARAAPVIDEILARWPTPDALLRTCASFTSSGRKALVEMLRPLGLQSERAATLARISSAQLNGGKPTEAQGAGRYCEEAVALLVTKDLATEPEDKVLRAVWRRTHPTTTEETDTMTKKKNALAAATATVPAAPKGGKKKKERATAIATADGGTADVEPPAANDDGPAELAQLMTVDDEITADEALGVLADAGLVEPVADAPAPTKKPTGANTMFHLLGVYEEGKEKGNLAEALQNALKTLGPDVARKTMKHLEKNALTGVGPSPFLLAVREAAKAAGIDGAKAKAPGAVGARGDTYSVCARSSKNRLPCTQVPLDEAVARVGDRVRPMIVDKNTIAELTKAVEAGANVVALFIVPAQAKAAE